jgi:hypothetical protein
MPAQFGGNDNDLARAQVDMAQQQRQDTLTDTAEADDHKTAGKCRMFEVGHVGAVSARGREAVRARADPVKPGGGTGDGRGRKPPSFRHPLGLQSADCNRRQLG